MALNKYMHDRNIYKQKKPDFKALADKYDFFREKVSQTEGGKVVLDFKEPSAVRALTRALLADDFGLMLDLPLDRMIPMVPQRLNYILWIEDIVGQRKHVRGIDIGTGSSCIFPLIGCRQNNWEYLASDIDDQNVHFARLNVEKNKLQDKIKIKQVSKDTLLCGLVEDGVSYDFCMCNPPFYTDHLEAQGISNSRNDDRPEPNSFSTACENESIAWGGEVRFVLHMLEESLKLRDKIRVYTSMLGKKSSIQLLKDELIKKKIPKFATTEFCQGRTMRWGIAWTFDESVNFPKSSFKAKKTIKPPLMYEVPRSAKVVSDYTVQAYTYFIKQELHELKIHYFIKHSGKFYSGLILKAKENNWSHQRRKRRQQKRKSGESETSPDKRKTIKPETGTGKSDETSPDKSKTIKSETVKGKNDEASPDESKTVAQSEPGSSKSDETSLDKGGSANGIQEINRDTSTENSLHKKIDDKNNAESKTDSKYKVANTSLQVSENSESNISITNETVDKKSSSTANCDIELAMEYTETKNCTEATSKNKFLKRGLEECNEDTGEEGGNKKIKLNEDKDALSELIKTTTGAIDLEASWKRACTMPPEVNTGISNCDDGNGTENGPKMLKRSEVIEQFWREQEGNKEIETNKRSEYQSREMFGENEECLVMCKLEIRKEDGEIKMIVTYHSGSREAMAQILQYFKNKITTADCVYGNS